MASYNELIALINAFIKQNGIQAITGQILNGVLRAMVDQIGRGYAIMGTAVPTDDPGTPDAPESWFASTPGTYTNFGGFEVADAEFALLSYTPSTGWDKTTLTEGITEVTAGVDNTTGTPSVSASYANGVLSFEFHNLKGATGDPAGFGTVNATVDANVGTPSVSVSGSGPDTAKNYTFAFHNLKGETGVTSVVATVDNTTGNPACAVSLVGQELHLDFTGLKGEQGNTGSSVDYPFTIVNNLTTDDATQALSAAMGVELAGQVSQLEAKVSMFVPHPNVDFTDDVLELWLIKTPGVEVTLQSYNNNAYIVCTGSTVYANTNTVQITQNNVPYPIKVYYGATEEFPIGTLIGYIMFRDVASFKSKSSQNMQIINAERCFNLANSPLIASALGEVTAKNATNAANATSAVNATSANGATNETNVTNASNEHSAFVKELYLFGDGVDSTKIYYFAAVARNHATYKYSIVLMQGNKIVGYLQNSNIEPQNPVLIPPYQNSGVSAYAIVRWDEFEDGTNNNVYIQFLPRVFDINYSPTIKAFIDTAEIQGDIAEIQGDIAEIQGDIADIQGDIVDIKGAVYDKITYGRIDFKDDYLYTPTRSIGDIAPLLNEITPMSSSSAAGHLTIPVKKGDYLQVSYKSLSNKYCRAFVLLDSERKILAWANPQTNDGNTNVQYNTFDSPLLIHIENDGYCLLQFTQADYNGNASMSVEYNKQKSGDSQQYESIEVCVPDTIYAVVGDTLQLYYRSIFRCVDFSKYAVKVVCNIGAQYPRYYEVTPLAGNVGTHTLEFTIKDNNNNTLGTKTVNLVVVPVGTNPESELNILCLGASATNGGQWASELKRRLVGTGGVPSGSGKTNILFVGRKDVTFAGQQVKLEATGGYTFGSYTNTTTARYRFNVSAENEPTINVDDVYSNNGNNYTVKEINITAGEGGYFSCDGTGEPLSSGTLTKVIGTGSETIVYSSTSFSGNPFVYNGAINMQQYADEYCNPQGAAHGRIDVIFTELFGNGTSVYTDDFTTRMSQMQTFINQVRAVFPNCKFCIGLFWNPDIRGGMGVNYGATGAWSDPYGIKYSNMNLCNALQKYITDNNLSDYVFILNWLNEFDEENDMQQTTKKVNVRSTVTEIFGVNGVHPATVGYYQMADTAWRLFVAKFCQS